MDFFRITIEHTFAFKGGNIVMRLLVERYAQEHEVNQELLSKLRIHSWNHPGKILCCKKGVYVFIKNNNRETMYIELCQLLKKVSG